MHAPTILIVEDDVNLLETLRYNFRNEQYNVLTASDGLKAVEAARKNRPDLIILDLMLPEMSGLDVCQSIRRDMNVPIIMLTAKAEEVDKILGLELGADDYVTKPFSMRELMARVRALLRRAGAQQTAEAQIPDVLAFGDVEIDVSRRKVTRDGAELELTPKEFDLLAFFARNKSFVFTREQLLDKVWGYEYGGDTRTVDVHVRWLRKKLEPDPQKPRHILTVRGAGYKLED